MSLEPEIFSDDRPIDYYQLIKQAGSADKRHALLLEQIATLNVEVAEAISVRSTRHHYVTVRPRAWWSFVPICRSRVRVWRMRQLDRPLWLGADGVIYFEYEDWKGDSYFMIAEIWLRDESGLMRIRDGLYMLKNSPNP